MISRPLAIAAGSAAAGFALFIAAHAASQTGPVDLDAADINEGRFVAVGGAIQQAASACIQCHGLNGVGDSTGAFPRLAGQSAWYLYKSLKDYASGLRPNDIMSPIAQGLTDEQMQDVAAYYASIEDAPYPPPPEVAPLTLQQGGAISAVGAAEQGVQGCVNCHGPAGTGMPPVYPYLAGQYAAYLELQLNLWREGTRDGDPLNVMENIAKQMTDEQIHAVSLYFASVRPAEAAQTRSDAPEPQSARAPATQTGTPPARQSESAPPAHADQDSGAGPSFGIVPQPQ